MKIKKQLVSQSIVNTKSHGNGNSCEYIAIHETANTSRGADAQAHANLQSNGNSRQASWHYQVDDKQVIQSFEDNIKCWHVGNGNNRAIAIEICVNSDGDFKKAVDNAIKLTQTLMKKHNIPINKVVQHNHFTGKECPRYLRDGSKGISWTQFINRVKGNNTTTPKPSKPSAKPTNNSTYTGNSIVDYLASIKQNPSFNNRKRLAKEYGIKGYKGTASQNTQLLKAMRAGKKVATVKPAPKPASRYPLPSSGTFKRGSKGNNVKQIQRALNSIYFKVGEADGIFGAKTEDAVRRFQKVYLPYEVDGVVGKNTLRELRKVVN